MGNENNGTKVRVTDATPESKQEIMEQQEQYGNHIVMKDQARRVAEHYGKNLDDLQPHELFELIDQLFGELGNENN